MTLYAQERMTKKEIEKKLMEYFSELAVVFTKGNTNMEEDASEEISDIQKMIKEELPTYIQTCVHETLIVYLESRNSKSSLL